MLRKIREKVRAKAESRRVDRRSPDVAARDVLTDNQFGDLEHNGILVRWYYTLDKFSDLVEYLAVKRFDRQTQEKVERLIGKESALALQAMGLRTIEKSLYLALKDAEWEERERKAKREEEKKREEQAQSEDAKE